MTAPGSEEDEKSTGAEGVSPGQANPDTHGAAREVEEAESKDDDLGPTPGGG